MKTCTDKIFSMLGIPRFRAMLRKGATRLPASFNFPSEWGVLQCCVSYNEFGGFCVPLSSLHRPVAQKILTGEVWEPDTIDFMVSHAGDGDIVHAGTYFGDFIPALSRACSGDSKLWAFEPNPENYRCARMTTAINNLSNVAIANAGLGAINGTMSMSVVDDAGLALGGTSRLMDFDSTPTRAQMIQVNILRLDEVIPADRMVTIIQLDVEGHEQQALTGALKTITRCKPYLILENLPESGWLHDNIFNLGYTVSGKLHQNTLLSPSAAGQTLP